MTLKMRQRQQQQFVKLPKKYIVGSMIANKVSKNYVELGIVPLGSLGVAITLFIIPTLQNVNIIAGVFFI
jgi:acyl-[acyl-carrier-protein]-phospholipid O-acyltransferase/long-chain-fatty-acid--[acyl-carrier-protein] ligase